MSTSFNWTLFIRVIFAIFTVQLIGLCVSYAVSVETLHIFRQVQLFLTFQLLLFMGSMLIWYRLSSVLLHNNASSASLSVASANNWSKFKDGFRAFLIVYLLLVHFSWFTHQFFSNGIEPLFVAWLAFVCVGCYIHLIVLSLIFMVAKFAYRLASAKNAWIFTSGKFHSLITLNLSIFLTCFCVYVASLPPVVKYETIILPNLPKRADGFRITLVADFHIGPTVGRSRLQTAVNIINELKSDIVAISGDLVDGSDEKFANAVLPLRDIRSKYGVYYCTGNHEYYHAVVDNWFKTFRSLGVNVLHNSNVKIKLGDDPYSSICLAGVDDWTSRYSGQPGHGMNASAALHGCRDTKGPVIMLVHQPNGAKIILDNQDTNGKIDLILSGHTHGGQLYVIAPFAYFTNSYYWGLYQHSSGSQVYVTTGVYFWGPPMKMYRLNEIVALTLRSPAT